MRMRSVLVTAAVVATQVVAGGAAAADCAPAAHAGGDWPSYGHDLHNTRTQPAETLIGTASAGNLAPGWTFSVADNAGTGAFQSTPAIADGCVFVATEGGWVYALNADTGAFNWSHKFDGGVFGMTVEGGRAYALVNRVGSPYAAALDAGTGDVLWTSEPVAVSPGFRTNASAVVFEGLLFFGYSVPEGNAEVHAGFAILDGATGQILKNTYVIPEEDWEHGYGGGGVWTTAVIDEANRYAYVGTSNPTSKKVEHRHTNAVLKIDLDRARPTFGEIVDDAKGTYEQYYPGLDRQPACREAGDDVTYFGFSVTCVQLDLDFGASPNLFPNDEGELLVGILQKSGVYHVFYADTMQQAWTNLMAPPCLQCNFSTTAYDGAKIYGVGTPPGQMVALERHQGGYAWVSPIGDGLHHGAVSTANGVVYTVDTLGFLDAFDAATGLPLVRRPILADAGEITAGPSSNGVAIARNTVYAASGGVLVAYRVPA